MQTSFALLALAATSVLAQGVTEQIAPKAPAPPGCQKTLSGEFEIGALKSTPKRSLEKRDCAPASSAGALRIKLADGILTDNLNRVGYIASNRQFQFDGPPQAGAIYTAGFSACSNGSLALGGSTVFYQCLSGSFFNLYDQNWAEHCEAITIHINPCFGSLPSVSAAPVTMTSSSAPAVSVSSMSLSMKSDGEVQAPTSVPASSSAVPTVVPVPSGNSSVTAAPTGASNSTATISSATLPASSSSGAPSVSPQPSGNLASSPRGFAFELSALFAGAAAYVLL